MGSKNPLRLGNIETLAAVHPTELEHQEGYAYLYRGRWTGLTEPDNNSFPRRSRLIVVENGKLLGPAHAAHVEIRTEGAGRYSHWEGDPPSPYLLFSTSDNSDPRSNGRLYHVGVLIW